MPKKKNKKKDKQYSQTWLITLIAVIIFFIFAKMMVGLIATTRDKSNFSRIEKDILSVKTELSKTNPLMTTEIKKYCHQDNEKFGGGNLNCIVELRSNSSYAKEEMLSHTKKNQEALINAGYSQLREPDYNSLFETGSIERKGRSEACRLYYDSSNEPNIDKKDRYYLVFRCAEQVNKFIYPVK